ncbi:MAG: DUF3307 domain-containing protein [Candidatus Nealsonbacteria bacterium]
MTDLFARILLGHLVGDYLLQNKAMMLKKSEKGLNGVLWCTIHCLVYTTAVCLFLWTINPWVIIAVFISHWPIDRWSLGTKWMKLIHSRELKDDYPENKVFYAIVYVAVDNTWHLVLMWLAINLLL